MQRGVAAKSIPFPDKGGGAAFGVLRASCFVLRSSFFVLRASCFVLRSAFDVRRSGFGVLGAAVGKQWSVV